jgi:hypothetical protein
MASHARVLNTTNGCRLKRSQALNRIDQCISAWVEQGFTIRDLTLAERVQARTIQARLCEPLPNMELPGLVFEPSQANLASTRRGYDIIRQAHAFAAAQ